MLSLIPSIEVPINPWLEDIHRRLDRIPMLEKQAMLRRLLESEQFLLIRYSERLVKTGVEAPVGSLGYAYDNALAEAIKGFFNAEVINCRGPLRGLDTVEYTTLEWVYYFNNRRLFEAIGNILQAEFEKS